MWLVLSVLAGAGGCNGNTHKDQNYGKDVGLVYEPPEGGVVSGDGGQDAGATTDGASGDAGVDQLNDATADAE
jgi:hypothetical protein